MLFRSAFTSAPAAVSGGYVDVVNPLNASISRNTILAGFFTGTAYDISIIDTGSLSSQLNGSCIGNTSQSQFPIRYSMSNVPDTGLCYQISDNYTNELVLPTPTLKLRDVAGTAYATVSADSSGALNISADPGNVASSTKINLKIDGVTVGTLDQYGTLTVNYLTMPAVLPGSASINSMFSNSSTGKLCWKDSGSVVNALY